MASKENKLKGETKKPVEKKPAKGGIPAVENIKAANEKAITGLVFERPEKAEISKVFSFSASLS